MDIFSLKNISETTKESSDIPSFKEKNTSCDEVNFEKKAKELTALDAGIPDFTEKRSGYSNLQIPAAFCSILRVRLKLRQVGNDHGIAE